MPGECSEPGGADLTFPDDKDPPAGLPQLALVGPVSLLRPLELGLPIIAVAFGDAAVSAFSMLMPEAAVDEDRGRVALEHNVRLSGQGSHPSTLR